MKHEALLELAQLHATCQPDGPVVFSSPQHLADFTNRVIMVCAGVALIDHNSPAIGAAIQDLMIESEAPT
jgi:hypothetical protein